MLRTFVCAVLALGLFVGVGFTAAKAQKKKKKGGATGQIVKVDAEKGTITVKVKVKKNTEEKEFKVTDKTTVTEVKGEEKTEVKAGKVSELLKKEQFKEGANVTIEPSEEDATTAKAITIGAAKKKKKKNQ